MPLTPPVARSRSSYVWIWFACDALLALCPPIYWRAARATPTILGLPCSIVYFCLLGVFITASLLAAYRDDERRRTFT